MFAVVYSEKKGARATEKSKKQEPLRFFKTGEKTSKCEETGRKSRKNMQKKKREKGKKVDRAG